MWPELGEWKAKAGTPGTRHQVCYLGRPREMQTCQRARMLERAGAGYNPRPPSRGQPESRAEGGTETERERQGDSERRHRERAGQVGERSDGQAQAHRAGSTASGRWLSRDAGEGPRREALGAGVLRQCCKAPGSSGDAPRCWEPRGVAASRGRVWLGLLRAEDFPRGLQWPCNLSATSRHRLLPPPAPCLLPRPRRHHSLHSPRASLAGLNRASPWS